MYAQKIAGMTATLSLSVLAAGTTSTITTTGTHIFAIKSKGYSHAALTNQATPTTDFATSNAFLGVKGGGSVVNANGFGSVFVYGFDAAGVLRCCQGSITALDASGNFVVNPQMPELPDAMAPFGVLIIKAGNTGDAVTGWIQGTANQAGVTGITYLRYDVMLGMPDRPLAS